MTGGARARAVGNHVQELESLVDSFTRNFAYMKAMKNNYNETSCRTEYIDPFLEMLGWDVSNRKGLEPQFREVIAEYKLSREERPDYSLTLSGVPKIFVEAKKPSVNILLDPKPALQARKYGWNAGHRIVALTNFEYLVLYDATVVPHEGDSPAVARYKVYHYTDYVEKFDEISRMISRDAVYSGTFDTLFDEEFSGADHATESIDVYFLKQVNEWRVRLANSLHAQGGAYEDVNVLNDVVQEFINQIVFLRICEDRNLPLYHSLQQNVEDEGQLHSELETMFRAADKRYNSGLFSGRHIIFDLDNDVIEGIVRGLYYPQSPYLFNIIEPNMLGRMYEMFLTQELAASPDGTIALTPKKEFRDRSVVTTPIEIVRYIVEKAVGELCAGRTPTEIKRLRIADIACGSGVFLEEAFAELQKHCVEWYLKNDARHLEQIAGGRYKLPIAEKREILTHCIYGIDIDVHAVEVARFSLLIKLIEDENTPSVISSQKILPDLSGNIFYGNSLVDDELLRGINISDTEKMSMTPFDWSDMGVPDGFDAIIGNPPYVSTADMHALLPKAEVDIIYKKKYRSSYKQFDKYYIFIERALSKLKDGGLLCYIVPNKFFTIVSGRNLRGIVAGPVGEPGLVRSIDDFGDAQLFAGKTIYSSILFLQKSQQRRFVYSSMGALPALWNDKEKDSVTVDEERVGPEPWCLTTDMIFMRLLEKMEPITRPITDYVNIFNGIQTSAERPKPIYWFTKGEMTNESETEVELSRNGKMYRIEKSILRPYFKPVAKEEKGLNSYSPLTTDKYIIFPYDASGRLIPIDEMKMKYPGTWEYLVDNYSSLVPKTVSPTGTRDVPNATADTWYQYGRTQALSSFTNTPKLIVRILSKDDPMYAYDDKDMLIASGGTAGYCAITAKPSSPYGLEYIQAWLSNPYTERIISMNGSDFEGGFVSRGTAVLKKLPIVPLDLKDTAQDEMYRTIVGATRKVYAINKAMQGVLPKARTEQLQRQKRHLVKEIENTVTSIYELRF